VAARRGRESKGESKGERERESETQREREITSESERECLCWRPKRTCRGVHLRRQSVCLDLVQIEEKRGARRVRQLTGSLRVLQCVAVCCSVLQAANSQAHSVCCSVLQCVAVCCRLPTHRLTPCVTVCHSVLQCVAVCCRVWQCVAVCDGVLHQSCRSPQCIAVCCSCWCVAVCGGVLLCVAVHHSDLKCVLCVVVCFSVLLCVERVLQVCCRFVTNLSKC